MAVSPVVPTQPTVADLGRKVKAKYPAYARYDDAELGRKVKAKYPAYSRYADVPAAPSFSGVEAGASTAVDPRRAVAEVRSKVNPYSQREVAQPVTPQNPIAQGFTSTIYGGNVAGAGRTVQAIGAATGFAPAERAGQAITKHGERFTGPPPPPDIFQIAPNDPAGRQKVMDYLGYALGSGMASSAPSLVGGLVGGLATRTTAGAVAGAAIPAYLMNTGDRKSVV